MKRASERRADQAGFALLIVLWIFVVLFAVGAEFAQGMRDGAAAAKNFADETQSYYLATAAANRTFYRALRARDEALLGATPEEMGEEVEEPLVPTDGEWHREEMWGAPVWVRVTDEGAKVPLNTGDEHLLRQVLGNLGLGPDEAADLAASMLDWVDRDDEHRIGGAESDYYRSLPRPYLAKNAPFDSLEELRLVKGVTPELYEGGGSFPVGLAQVFTVFNRTGTLNVRGMPPPVLRAVFGLDEEELAQVLETREFSAPALLATLEAKLADPTLAELLVDEPPAVLRVDAQARLPSARVGSRIGAVIDVGESNEGVYVLRWMDSLPIEDVS